MPKFNVTALPGGIACIEDKEDGVFLRCATNIKFPLFKFTSHVHAQNFRRNGSLRIGTLFDFHAMELHGEHRGDDTEGVFPFLQPDGQPMTMTAQNNWMFCVSRDFNARRLREFGGSGYKINHPGFFLEVTRALRKKTGQLTTAPLLANVEYVDKSKPHPNPRKGYFAGLIKDHNTYQWQNEARVLWETDPPIPMANIPARPEEFEAYHRQYIEREKLRIDFQLIDAPQAVHYCGPL